MKNVVLLIVLYLGTVSSTVQQIVSKTVPAQITAKETYSPVKLTSQIFDAEHLRVEGGPDKKYVSRSELPCSCHVQGIGVTDNEEYYVITCQSKDDSGRAYLLLYNFEDDSALDVLEVNETLDGKDLDHPSSIQIENYKFPVAFAAAEDDKSLIRFFKIENDKLQSIIGCQRIENDKHIGALGYSTIGSNTYMVALGWDAKNVHIYKSNGTNRTDNFDLIYEDVGNPTISNDGVDTNWSAYNSCWLGETTNNKIVLLATHGPASWQGKKSWLDTWEIISFDSNSPVFKKRNKNWKSKSSDKGHFYEGVTIIPSSSNLSGVKIFAFPHDYGTSGCTSSTRCSTGLYELYLKN